MFRPMKYCSLSVSVLLFISCIQLLFVEIRTAGATIAEEKVVHRQLHLRKGASGEGNIDGEIENTNNDARSLIVGGSSATNFPRSVVFLSDRIDDLQCGGTLISPTVVLAAGHCEISLVHEAVFLRFDSDKKQKNAIRIKVTEEILHPQYNRKNLQNDVMLIVLEKSPNEIDGVEVSPPLVPYMKLHTPQDLSLDDMLKEISHKQRNRSFRSFRSLFSFSELGPFGKQQEPPVTTDLQLRALGWGHTADGEYGAPSGFLKEVDLNWVENDECERAKENEFISYQDRITDDMMCTWRSGHDTCHGDSGGPIIVDNPNYKKNQENEDFEFLQVGIISWGEDCADHVFPGVASRVSVAFDWIRNRVCSIDGAAAPAYFECDDEHTYSPAPSTSPTTRDDAVEAQLYVEALNMVNDPESHANAFLEDTTIEVCAEIFLDVYAFETSWTLSERSTGATLHHVPYRSYKFENSIRECFDLEMGHSYQFTIYDQFGDGIQKNGWYRIFIVDESQYESVGTILLEDDGDFGTKRSQWFQVPMKTPPNPTPRGDNLEKQEARARNKIGQMRDAVP